jgi:predicted transcriptional regulator YdeE
MYVAGLRRRHTFGAAANGIAEQWREFLMREVPTRIGTFYYGVMCGADASGLEYMCGVQVSSFDSLPAETGRIRIPPQHYAVFSPALDASLDFTWQRILAWLETGPYESAHKPDFELYRNAPDATSEPTGVEIWVGVIEKAGQ